MFRFRLEKILQLRRKLRDAKKAELGYVDSQIRAVEAELEGVYRSLRELDYPEGVASFGDLGRIFDTAEFLRRREKELLARKKELYELRERVLSELVEHQKQVRILEKLKEKKGEEFRREMLKKEIAFLDDFASRRGSDVAD